MSMSTHVVGFRPADAKWKEMKTIWEMCERAKIKIPDEVQKFFNGEAPGDKPGQEVEINVKGWSDDSRQGYELDLTKLPKDVRFIRFYNSW